MLPTPPSERKGYIRQGSVVKKSPSRLQLSHRVTLSEAKGLSRSAERSFASLRMTGLTLSVGEELSLSFEPCLISIYLFTRLGIYRSVVQSMLDRVPENKIMYWSFTSLITRRL